MLGCKNGIVLKRFYCTSTGNITVIEPHQLSEKALYAKAEINEIMESFKYIKRERDIWQKMAI